MADLPKKSANLIDWYLAAVEAANLTDKRYPVKGMNVWTPYGFQVRRLLDAIMVREIEATGSRPVEFPTLIPETEFQKEKEHIKGFDAQVYWVTRGGDSPLDVNLVLRPTSETAMYPVFALWIRSHRDLPLNVYQIVNTFRYETKTTRPFVRVREIHFFEEHTCQVDEDAATARVRSNLGAFREMARALGLPYVALRRPEWDKFPGAFYTVAFDIPIGEGRTLQLGSVHHYRENFSRPYGISFEAPDGSSKLVHQTTFGLSERLIGAVAMAHGDDKGLVLPPAVAPYDVVIVPIPSAGAAPNPEGHAQSVAEMLRKGGQRVHVDLGPDRPGAKYYRWETAGVPLRLEIGRREAADGSATAVDRLGRKSSIGREQLADGVRTALESVDAELRARAESAFQASFRVVSGLPELKGMEQLAVFGWCGSTACGHQIEEAYDGSLLGTPEDPLPLHLPKLGPCLACGTIEKVGWAVAGRPI